MIRLLVHQHLDASALGNAGATRLREFLFPKHHHKCEKSIALSLLFLILFLFHCAKEGMPPGGPEDTTPPKVVSVSPKPDSTEVSLNSRIEITFSERMSEDPTEAAIFISPFPTNPFDFNWRGRTLIISSSEPFLKDKTYVVTIGTDAQDLRRNRLSQSYTFAFSTGRSLDYGTISGEVWVKQQTGFGKETGISIWAYLLGQDRTEINPENEKPDYVTQTDEEGKYSLRNLSLGMYRLFAVQDVDRDLLWGWENEAIGVTTEDVELTEQDMSKPFVDFIIEKKDKSRPSLLNCKILNQNSVKLEFDKEIEEKAALDLNNFNISSISTQKLLKIISAYYQDTDTKELFLLTEGMNPKEKYELKVLDLKDKAGNPMDTSSRTCIFEGSEIQDTVGPQILAVFPKDGTTNVPFDTKIKLSFDQPPETQTVEANFSLVDSNEIKITGKVEWSSPNAFVFSPDSLLSGKMKYKINLLGKGIFNLLGTFSMRDSIFTSSFVTLDPDTLGSVSGKAEINERIKSAPVILSLWQVEPTGLSYQMSLSQSESSSYKLVEPFLFERILPGKYLLSGYIDLNRDEDLTLGQPEPFSPMEPFAHSSDTIYVRSRWETEGVELKFRKR
jgi:hypothetical protein